MTLEEAKALVAGMKVTDGTTVYEVTGVGDKPSGVLVYLVLPGDDLENTSFFTEAHLHLMSVVSEQKPIEPTTDLTVGEPIDVDPETAGLTVEEDAPEGEFEVTDVDEDKFTVKSRRGKGKH